MMQQIHDCIYQYRKISSKYLYMSPSLVLRDIAGHERFNHMTRVYYKYA